MARGSILSRRLKDGSTVHLIKYRTRDGRQVKRTVGPSLREAERALNEALSDVDGGKAPARPSRETFSSYVDRWLHEHGTRIEPGTLRAYKVDVERRLKPRFGHVRLDAITTDDVRAFVADLAAEGKLAPKTINNTLVTLRVALGHAVEDKLLPTNPASSVGRRDRIKLPAPHREMDFLRLEEIPAYLAACAPNYRPLAEVLLGAGLRIGEALALTWCDVDWRSGALVVTRSSKREGTGSTKGDRNRRVEIGPRLLAALADRRAAQAEHHADDDGQRLMFPGRGGGHADRSHVSLEWHRAALKSAGLRQTIRLHDLRHSAAASWLGAGLPMIYVQRQLGHASITTTIELYGHLEEGSCGTRHAGPRKPYGAPRKAVPIWYHAPHSASQSSTPEK
jgi:integrase